MKTLKVIGNCCLVFLAIISIFVAIFYGYYKVYIQTTGVNNVGDQLGIDIKKEEDLTEEEKSLYEERWFMEANYYSNDKNNGIALQELNFNYFRDWHLTSNEYRASGMQYIGKYEHTSHTISSDEDVNTWVNPAFYYYDTTDGISYSGYFGNNASVSTILKRETSFTIKIDNKPYEIRLDKSYKTGWWLFSTTYYRNYGELFKSVMTTIESNSAGYGDYYVTLDLSDYFTIKAYDENGKLKTDDVTDIIKNYAVLKFHYDENGAKNSTQSMFGSIQCNPNYGINDEDIDTSYSQEKFIYNLNDNYKLNGKCIFEYRESDIYNGYFLSLNLDVKKLFNNDLNALINVTIDLQSKYLLENNINIVGLDYNAFENFRINELTIIGSSQTFYMLEKSLYNTDLKTLKYSNGINFDFATDYINSEYTEEIL